MRIQNPEIDVSIPAPNARVTLLLETDRDAVCRARFVSGSEVHDFYSIQTRLDLLDNQNSRVPTYHHIIEVGALGRGPFLTPGQVYQVTLTATSTSNPNLSTTIPSFNIATPPDFSSALNRTITIAAFADNQERPDIFARIAAQIDAFQPDIILGAGDHASRQLSTLPCGFTNSIVDTLYCGFQKFFFDVLFRPRPVLRTPMIIARGNHDHGEDPVSKVTIPYPTRLRPDTSPEPLNNYWNTLYWGHIGIAIVGGNSACDSELRSIYCATSGNCTPTSCITERYLADGCPAGAPGCSPFERPQFTYFKNTFASAAWRNATHKIILSHHQDVYSWWDSTTCTYTAPELGNLKKYLFMPWEIDRPKADLWIGGHSHAVSHLNIDRPGAQRPFQQMVIGGAGGALDTHACHRTLPTGTTELHPGPSGQQNKYFWVKIIILGTRLDYFFIDEFGVEFYRGTIINGH